MDFRPSSALLWLTVFGLLLPTAATAQNDRGIAVTAGSQVNQTRRIALVIGNGSYSDAPLKNPVNDARDVAAALKSAGFEVLHFENASQKGMKEAVREFGNRLRRSEIGLFYYAGHGIQSNGRNYLVPIGANITREPEVEYETVDLGFVMAQMDDAGNPLNLVILDACRNNPFARSFRSSATGLAQVSAPTGTLIAYATAPGSVASDGNGRNGLYTQELLRYMKIPGLSVEEVFKQVRIAVRMATNGAQTPWESSSLVGQFSFASGLAGAVAAAQPMMLPPAQQSTAIQQQSTAMQQQQSTAMQGVSSNAANMRTELAASAPVASAPAASGPSAPVSSAPSVASTTAPTTVTMAGPSVGTGATADAALPGAVELCAAALRNRDVGRLTVLHTAANPQDNRNRAALLRWAKTPGAAFDLAAAPLRNLAAASREQGSAEFAGKMRWRSNFGGTRTADVTFKVDVANASGNWQLRSCRIVGAPKLQ